jgi:hypothetical protein
MNYETYTEAQLETEESDEILINKMRKGNELARMQLAYRKHMLYGDIYIIHPNELVADAKGHKLACPDSTATTIEEMAQERITQLQAEQE